MLRRLLAALAVLLLLLAVVTAGSLWWLGTESGLRFAVTRLQGAMTADGSELRIDDASGSLYRGVRIGRLTWRSVDGMTVEGSNVSARWSLPALLRRHVLVPELAADSLSVKLAAAAPDPAPREPMEMPGVFALPVSIELQRLAVAELRVTPAPGEQAPAPEPIVIKDLAAKFAYRDGSFVVSNLGALTPYGLLTDARVELGDRPPHPLAAVLHWQGELAEVPFDLALDAAGDLDSVETNVTGSVADADIALAAKLAPLETMPLTSARADLAQLDLRRLFAAAPQTLIDAELSLAPAADGSWSGNVALRNQDSGVLSAGKLPLLSLDTRLSLANPDNPATRRLRLEPLKLTLPGPPEANASGSIEGFIDVQPGKTITVAEAEVPQVQAELAFTAVDIAQFGAQLPATALDGKLNVQGGSFALDLEQSAERVRALMPAALAKAAGAAEVALRGRIEHSLLHLEEARLRLGDTRLAASGQAGLTAPHRITVKGDARNIELAQWLPQEGIDARWRDGRISGTWSIDGTAIPGFDGRLTLALADSTLAGAPLVADIGTRLVLSEQWAPRRLEKAAVDLRLGRNHVRASGALGNVGDKLALDASVPDPGLLDPRLDGRLTLAGDLGGAFDRLRARLTLNGEQLAFAQEGGKTTARSLKIEANAPAAASLQADAPIDLSIRLRGVEAAQRKLDSLDLTVNGKLAEHRFGLNALADGHTLKLNGNGQATLAGEPSWRARLASATLEGKVPIRLTEPASIRVDADSLDLTNFAIAVAGGSARLERLRAGWGEAASFDTRGAARDLPITRLLALADANPDLGVLRALRLEADWNLKGSGAEDLSGSARVGLREAPATDASAVAAVADGSDRLGLEGDNGATVKFTNGRVDGRFDLRLPSLAFTHPLTAPDLVLDGRIRLAGTVDGTLAQPLWHADLTGEELAVLQRSVGWRLTEGVLAARMEGRKVEVKELKFASGEGTVALQGQASLLDAPRAPRTGAAKEDAPSVVPIDGRFDLTASRFEVPIGPGQRVALSGTTRLESSAEGLSLRGKLRTDHGIIEIQGSSAPSLPGDVKLVYDGPQGKRIVDGAGKQVSSTADGADSKKQGRPIRILTDLAVDLGDRVRITGNGVAARLGGNLQVLGTLPDNPRLVGVVNIVEGSYQAYGQNLRIDKGAAIRFNGPVDNPSLDLVAKRPFLPVEVGVSITGTALNPVITAAAP